MSHDQTLATVLVVDDNELNVNLLVSMLEREQYHIYAARNGETALDLAAQHHPDIILLDIMMPNLDGYEVCKMLKHSPETADIPVVFISAKGDTQSIVKGFDVGGVDYVTKPFKFREVLARVRTQLTIARQKREIELMHSRERQQFERVDSLRRQFINSATHDLKNPLFVISGYADMLETSPEIYQDENLMSFVTSIQRGVDRMMGLVFDMLDLLQLETAANLQVEALQLDRFLNQITNDLTLSAQNKDIQLDLTVDEPIEFKVDRKRLERILDNLISNAIKYTPEGGHVQVIGRGDERAHQVVIEVIDTGLGIPESLLNEIFKPFKRVNSEEHMSQEGTGLGLSIVKTLIDQLQGHIEVDSQLGKGSCFRLLLPM